MMSDEVMPGSLHQTEELAGQFHLVVPVFSWFPSIPSIIIDISSFHFPFTYHQTYGIVDLFVIFSRKFGI